MNIAKDSNEEINTEEENTRDTNTKEEESLMGAGEIETQLAKFFEILLASRNDLISPTTASAFVLGFAFMVILVPWQAFSEDGGLMIMNSGFLFGVGVILYINPYIKITENQQQTSVFSKLTYYPADMKEVKKYLLKKLRVFIRKIFFAALVLQLLISLIGYHSITVANVVYVAVTAYIWPMIIGGSTVVLSK